MKIDRPLWAAGALLSPQQFQQQARWEAWANERLAHLSLVHPWGIQAVGFDMEALRLGKLKATLLRLRMPDGTLIDSDLVDRLPDGLELGRLLPDEVQVATLLLALPLEQANGNNCLFDAARADRPTRYRQDWRQVQDIYADEVQSVGVLEHVLSLRFDRDENGDYLTCPIARLVRDGHPACPDVDWARVEQWCQGLFEQNGADLQTAAAFALARSQRRGLEGMGQGVALIDALGGQWTSLWPAMSSVRLDILAWLFMQWQPLLRGMTLNAQNVPALVQLDSALLRLQRRLDDQVHIPVPPLQVLRQQLESLILRLQHSTTVVEPLLLPHRESASPLAMPMIIWPASPPPEMQRSKPRTVKWACAAAAMIMLAGGVWWAVSVANIEGMQRVAGVFQQAQPVPAPVRLDSLLLFGPGSAELRPDSTKVLINALIDIKARPGWLIVISAHTDNSGDAE